ncbi:MAG: lipopolysaccharide biosynthesis protein, partial [Chitinophagaceae bacterium]
MALAGLSMPSYIFKFYHYYGDHLPFKKNDMITWALVVSCTGFVLVMIAGWLFKDLVIRKFGEHSPQLLAYYYWIFPMGFGLTIYTTLEVYTWNVGKPVLTNFLKEVQWRLIITLMILLMIAGVIKDFDTFIKLYAFTYPAIALTLFIYLVYTKKIHFTFKVSKVSRRFFKKIVAFCLFVYAASIVQTLSQVFDSIVIASVLQDGLKKAGIFALAQICTNIIQAPQRGIVAAAIPHLARAWKDKNRELLQRIYERSSINQLIFSLGLFLLIAINYTDVIKTFGLKNDYLLGFNAFIVLGMARIVDMGTGLNAQIIGTSNYWKFELTSGIVLLLLTLPLTYVFARHYDLVGAAIASLISIIIFNIIRIVFLWKKYKLFPFSMQTLYTLLVGFGTTVLCYFAFHNMAGFPAILLRSFVFFVLFAGLIIYFNMSPDIRPVMQSLMKRLGIKPPAPKGER